MRLVVVFALLPLACATAPADAPPASQPSAEEAVEMPTPFTADQIQAATPAGKRIVFKTWSAADGDGQVSLRFIAVDDDGADFERIEYDAEGNTKGDGVSARETWVALRDHAKFPAAHTQRRRDSLEIAMGKFETIHYQVADPEKGTVTHYWFSPKHPGPPLKVLVTAGENEVFSMEMTESS